MSSAELDEPEGGSVAVVVVVVVCVGGVMSVITLPRDAGAAATVPEEGSATTDAGVAFPT